MSAIGVRVGVVIRAMRKRRGLSQEALAALANINRTYLSEIERGLAVPSIVTLDKLAGALGEKLSAIVVQCE